MAPGKAGAAAKTAQGQQQCDGNEPDWYARQPPPRTPRARWWLRTVFAGVSHDPIIVDVRVGTNRANYNRQRRRYILPSQLVDFWAAPLDQYYVSPPTVVAGKALPHTNNAEARPLVQPQAGRVFREDAGLDSPDSGRLGGVDQSSK
jgi:hypothetical protein